MLFLQLPLLLALLVGGDNEENKNSVPEGFQEPVSFKVICVLSFHNSSWAQSLGSAWLGELQTHGWKSNPGTFIYLWPWSKGNFSNDELMEVQNYLHMSFIRFVQAFYGHARKWKFELRPEAWLSLGSNSDPGQLTLVCHVSGFYPKPISVMWMQGEQEQQGTQISDILPNTDGTSYLRVSLDVEASEASGLSCRVKHSSLGGQDIILYWDHHSSVSWIALAVIVTLVLMAGLTFWLWKHWTHRVSPSSILPLE